MNCPTCQRPVQDTAKFCPFCGAPLANQQPQRPQQPPQQPYQQPYQQYSQNPQNPYYGMPMLRTNPFAIAGFVLSLVGLFLFPIVCGALGIIFSALGYNRISNAGNVFKGKGLAIAGLVIGIVDVVFFFIRIAASGSYFSWYL